MHAVFMLYGIKNDVDFIVNHLNSQFLPLRIYKEGEQDKFIQLQCQVRLLPFGLYEFVFPKEYMSAVLTSLRFNETPPYDLSKGLNILGKEINPLKFLKKYLNIKDIPEFKTDKKMVMPNIWVSIIPIGIREDGEITEKEGELVGWKHEAI